jgi:hypothetical protein
MKSNLPDDIARMYRLRAEWPELADRVSRHPDGELANQVSACLREHGFISPSDAARLLKLAPPAASSSRATHGRRRR